MSAVVATNIRPGSANSLNIGIAGAGLMGRVLACYLLRAGHRVTLFDRDPVDSGAAAAYTAAGMLAPWAELEQSEMSVFRLGLRSLRLWPELLRELGREVDFHQRGSLVVAHAADAGELVHFRRRLAAKLTGADQLRDLDAAALEQLEPALTDVFDRALWLPGEAWLDSRRTMAALAGHLQAAGAAWQPETAVLGLEPGALTTTRGRRRFDSVIDCRGLGARDAISGLRGVRGELLWLHAPRLRLQRPVRLLHPRYRLYLVPRRDNILVLGATQLESDDVGPVTVRSALELLSAAYSMHSELGEARLVHSEANCRPALADNQPDIVAAPGLIRVNGLFRHGFLLAPALAQDVIEHLHRDAAGGRPAVTDNEVIQA